MSGNKNDNLNDRLDDKGLTHYEDDGEIIIVIPISDDTKHDIDEYDWHKDKNNDVDK